jgi:hypothetical protein
MSRRGTSTLSGRGRRKGKEGRSNFIYENERRQQGRGAVYGGFING